MTPAELAQALKELDRLDIVQTSFRTWLYGDQEANTAYDQLKQQIEDAFPGLHVVQVNITYKTMHVLVAD